MGAASIQLSHRQSRGSCLHLYVCLARKRRRPARGRGASELGLLGNLERVVDLNAEISNRTLQLRMTEEELDRS